MWDSRGNCEQKTKIGIATRSTQNSILSEREKCNKVSYFTLGR